MRSHAMPFDSLDAALAAGALIVTPNNRLARQVVMRHDAAQRQAGRRAWLGAAAIPWRAFVDALWTETIARDVELPLPVQPAAALHLWQSIIEADEQVLLDARGAAHGVAEAYARFHEYRDAGEDWHAWRAAGIADDAASFARWATRFSERLAVRGCVDRAELPDLLALHDARWTLHPLVALVGFTELAPAHQRLLDVLRRHGTTIEHLTRPARAAQHARIACDTPTDELVQALVFAREHALRAPGTRVGIVVADLAARRDEALALADEILAPARLAPLAPDAPAPYGISLGVALAQVPIVGAALDLIALASVGLDAMVAASLLRSPYLPGTADAWQRRATIERLWREQGRARVRINDAAATLDRVDAALAERLRTPLSRRAATPRDWSSTWSAWLDAVGWPGARTLDSAEWQARERWQQLLAAFAALEEVAPSLDAAAALGALRAQAQDTVWAPQGHAAPIQILGVLEASGLDFDALWLAGFTADAWPPAPRPSPFLPIAWQRARNVPRASAARELGYARALTADFAHAAAQVVVSHARESREAPQALSPLFAAWPEHAPQRGPARWRDRIAAVPRARPAPWRDDAAPPLRTGADAGGGTGVIESQSACPFQAFARYRLHARGWDEPSEGLTPKERGTLLHFAMRAFWDAVRDHATLIKLDQAALEARVAVAVDAARGKLPAPRWRALAPAVAAGEAERLRSIIVTWLVLCEQPRPPFRVLMTESDTALALGGVRLRLKIDRVDTLDGEGVGVLDYKSGRVTAPSAWFKARPEGTQLGLYVLALKAAAPTRPVHAAAYAQIKAGQIKVSGVVAGEALWPGLTPPRRAIGTEADWRDLEAFWIDTLTGLGDEFRRGEARVTPRNAQACLRCDLQPVCRIRNLYDDAAREPVPDEDE